MTTSNLGPEVIEIEAPQVLLCVYLLVAGGHRRIATHLVDGTSVCSQHLATVTACARSKRAGAA